ncbi:Outer membrane cobalamin receptor protein [Parapedobacter koreensis]|uniref:Outer membrane cobalamin receptor protein n=2 Tax=Parapedobacter koreensis TaxID=332977 RepID=A0A1H7F5D2_9SPHI|nr:Outer membrane cobalamin receptor protein [Parapedobacter koreensis]
MHVYGQSALLSGVVQDEQGQAIPGASVSIGNQFASQITDQSGRFSFSGLRFGNYTLKVTHVGYVAYAEAITLERPKTSVVIQLIAQSTILDDVTVTGKTETQQAREQAIRAVVVDTRAVAEQPATLAELMNRAPGVRIRQSGGLGSQPDISMNGFQGRAVRYFKDGIPLSYLGAGYGIHNIPVNTLERVEVYKGVLPIALGADALGGAVNLISQRQTGNQLNASYEIASFNTHRLTVNAGADFNHGWYGGVEAFYNYSKNNYTAAVMVTDPDTRNQTEQNIELFHNAYKGYYTEGHIGLRNRPWADDLRLSLAYFDTERQQQHPALMTDPYGAVLGKQSSFVPSLHYQSSFFNDKLTIDQFAVANNLDLHTVDTARGYYDWFGQFTPVTGRVGESSRPSLSNVDIWQLTSRTYARWSFNERHALSINYVYMRSRREGEDPYGPRFSGTDIDVLSIPANYAKQVVGVDWSGAFTDQLQFSIMGKGYRYQSRGTESWANRPINLDEEASVSKTYGGVGGSLKYQYAPNTFARFSTEYAYRLPESEELFGDAMWVVPNFSLNPERSLNVNLGFNTRQRLVRYEVNAFYRETKGLILLVPTIAPYAQYRNINNVRGFGVEADAMVTLTNYLQATANVTWQSLRLFGFTSPQDLWRNGTRLQNTPFFFANAGLMNRLEPFANHGQLNTYLHYNFVREFYLQTIPKDAEPDGPLGLWGEAGVESAVIIPNQHLLSGGINYQFPANRYTLGIEVKNLANTRLYDYFRVQRAGRSFHLKLTYQITDKT